MAAVIGIRKRDKIVMNASKEIRDCRAVYIMSTAFEPLSTKRRCLLDKQSFIAQSNIFNKSIFKAAFPGHNCRQCGSNEFFSHFQGLRIAIYFMTILTCLIYSEGQYQTKPLAILT
jgi:hypothetical protein